MSPGNWITDERRARCLPPARKTHGWGAALKPPLEQGRRQPGSSPPSRGAVVQLGSKAVQFPVDPVRTTVSSWEGTALEEPTQEGGLPGSQQREAVGDRPGAGAVRPGQPALDTQWAHQRPPSHAVCGRPPCTRGRQN